MEELKPCPYSLSGEYRKALSMAISALNAQDLQPNLQPTCNLASNDCISRQAAIDALMDEVEPFAIVEPGTTCVIGIGVNNDDIVRVLEQLPSAQPDLSDFCDRLWKAAYERGKAEAQPDIIHCGECKYYHDSDGCFFSTATTGADGFCHWAERKDGEADETD